MSGNKSVSTVLLSLAVIVAVGLSAGIGLGLGFGGGGGLCTWRGLRPHTRWPERGSR